MFLALFFILGLAVGSLANAVVYRFKRGQNWLSGRSACPACGHKLAALDLVPLMSWLLLKGKCRYCGKAISAQYPISELAGAAVFASSYHYWPGGLGSAGHKFLLASWLIVAVGLLVLAIYDLNYHLLPSKILYPTAALAIILKIFWLAAYSTSPVTAFWHWIASVALASGIFYVIYQLSSGAWIGFGDVRLGLITGTVLAEPQLAMLMIFGASLLGLIFVLPSMVKGRRQLKSHIPYGPYLITAAWLALLFGQQLINWYEHLLT